MSDPSTDPSEDQHEAAEAERACLELKGQIARARRIVDRARQILSPDPTELQDEDDSARA